MKLQKRIWVIGMIFLIVFLVGCSNYDKELEEYIWCNKEKKEVVNAYEWYKIGIVLFNESYIIDKCNNLDMNKPYDKDIQYYACEMIKFDLIK